MSFLNKQPPNPNIGTYHEWKRQSIHEFARKFVSNEFSGFFSKKMTVNEGEGLLLMQGGKAISENLLGAGVYPLGNYFQASSVSGSSVAVLINTGEVSLQFSGDGIITCDGMCAGYEVTLSVELRKPDGGLDFYANVMKGCDAVSVFDLQSRFSKVVLTAPRRRLFETNCGENLLGIISMVLIFHLLIMYVVPVNNGLTFNRPGSLPKLESRKLRQE